MSESESKKPEVIEVPYYDEELKMEHIAVIEKEPALKIIINISAYSDELIAECKITPEETNTCRILESVYVLVAIKDLPKEALQNTKVYHFFKREIINEKKEVVREIGNTIDSTKHLLEIIESANIETFTELSSINKTSCECDDFETHSNKGFSDCRIAIWNKHFIQGIIQYTDYILGFEILRVIGDVFPFCITKVYRYHDKKGICTASLVGFNEVILFLSDLNASGLEISYKILNSEL